MHAGACCSLAGAGLLRGASVLLCLCASTSDKAILKMPLLLPAYRLEKLDKSAFRFAQQFAGHSALPCISFTVDLRQARLMNITSHGQCHATEPALRNPCCLHCVFLPIDS